MVKTLVAALLALTASSQAVPFRMATFNIGAYYDTNGAPAYSLHDPGTPDYENVKAILGRIDADVVALEEIVSADVNTSAGASDLQTLAASLGYSYVFIAPNSSAAPLTGPIDTSLRCVFLSKYQFLSTDAIRSPQGAKEMTRLIPVVKVDIPGTARPPIIFASHLRSGTDRADRFRRAIELKRLTGYLTSHNITNDDNFIIVGDYNLSSINSTFDVAPDQSDLGSTYVLGADVTFPVRYSTNPLSYFTNPIPSRPALKQVNGSTATYGTAPGVTQSAIDLILTSTAIAGRALSTEVYNSNLDTADSGIGLRKIGPHLAANASELASDHYAVFADIELDQDYPNLHLALTLPAVSEKSAAGTAQLIITLPAAAAVPVTVNLASDNPAIAQPVPASVTLPAGTTTATVDITTARNFFDDDGNAVSFTATATNYDPESVVLQVTDADGPYQFTAAGQTITEDFTAFDGSHDPAPWVTSAPAGWQGIDSGSSAIPGFRSYGAAANPSLGYLPDSSVTTPGTFSATYANLSGTTLTSLEISFTARQWRTAFGGTADHLTVAIATAGGTIQIPALSFTPVTNLPTGAVSSPADTLLTATISGLSIPSGQSFDLQFTDTPGAGGSAPSSDIFVNEIHYDNAGADVGEFVEVVVGPGFAGNLADVKLQLYRPDGTLYASGATQTLSTFTLGSTTSSGHKIYSKAISGLLNSASGLAIVNGAQVLHFISYGGSITATAGLATGLTSTNTGVLQTGSDPAGFYSLRLTGLGSSAANFTWATGNVANTAGAVNGGQTFVSAQSQGISIDDVAVKFLPSPDADSDGDGYTDAIETNLLLTDPNNANSRFSVSFARASATTFELAFPTLSGRKYLIQSSTNLQLWTDGTSYSGNGSALAIAFPIVSGEPKLFYRVVVSFE